MAGRPRFSGPLGAGAETAGFTATLREMREGGITTKTWTTRSGTLRVGRPFTKHTLRSLLGNPIYAGRMRLGDDTYEGQHEAIIDAATHERVQALLARHTGTSKGRRTRGGGGALLAGLLCCGSCDAPMLHTHTTKRGRRYRYYLCKTKRSEDWAACPTQALPAHEIETLAVDQIRAIGRDEGLIAEVLTELGPEVDAKDVRRALRLFDPVWDVLHASERQRVLGLLVKQMRYDPGAGTVGFEFHPTGIEALGEETPC